MEAPEEIDCNTGTSFKPRSPRLSKTSIFKDFVAAAGSFEEEKPDDAGTLLLAGEGAEPKMPRRSASAESEVAPTLTLGALAGEEEKSEESSASRFSTSSLEPSG